MKDYTESNSQALNATQPIPAHVGLDVHQDTIAVAIARWGPGVRSPWVEDRGMIANRSAAVIELMAALRREFGEVRVVYEAGACGFVIWRLLQDRGIHCEVAAPTLIPKKPGDRVKTDRRDARELARLSALGCLTPVWVPDTEQEAMRDLVRLRAD